MKILTLAYLFCAASLLPLVVVWARDDLRDHLLILLTACHAMAAGLAGSLPALLHTGPGSAAALLTGYAFMSCLWASSPHRAPFGALTLVSLLYLFSVAATVDRAFLVCVVFAPSPVFAGVTLYQSIRHSDPARRGSLFFNTNHAGAYLALQVFACYWLAAHGPLWIAAFLPLLAVSLALTRCRAAWVGVTAGACVYAVQSGQVHPLGLLGVLVVSAAAAAHVKDAWSVRSALFLAAAELSRQRPLFGWGLDAFRQQQFQAWESLTARHPRLKHRDWTPQAHRVHNDFLEYTLELGNVGVLFLAWPLFNLPWTADPILSAALTCVLADAAFFFPLREVHTAAPFWILAAALAGYAPEAVAPPSWLIAAAVAAVASRILYQFGIKKLLGLIHYRMDDIPRAVRMDPYNGKYLHDRYLETVIRQPATALASAMRALEHFDGAKCLWGVHDQYARAVFRQGNLKIAREAVARSLELNPDIEHTQALKAVLDDLEKKHHDRGRC